MPKYTKNWWENIKQYKMELIEIGDLQELLEKCMDEEERIILMLLYWTGARPAELLELERKHFYLEDENLCIKLATKKGGIGRIVYIQFNRFGATQMWDFVQRQEGRIIKKWKNPWNIRDFVYKISKNNLTAYFFRHNRMSKLANEGATIVQLKYFKGTKRTDTVEDYVHIAGLETKKLAKMLK